MTITEPAGHLARNVSHLQKRGGSETHRNTCYWFSHWRRHVMCPSELRPLLEASLRVLHVCSARRLQFVT